MASTAAASVDSTWRWCAVATRGNRFLMDYEVPVDKKPADPKATVKGPKTQAKRPSREKRVEAGIMNVETFGSRYDGIHPPGSAFAQKKLPGKTRWTVVPREGYNEVYGHN